VERLGGPGTGHDRQATMAKSEQVRVVFVPSGGTDWCQAGRVVGSTDLPLGAEFRPEVEALADKLKDAKLSVILSSPDEASVTTARAVASKVTGSPKIKPIDDLAEVCLGLWEGKLKADLEKKFPTAYRQWEDDPAALVVPEGETFQEAQARVTSALQKLLGKSNGDGAVGVVLRPIVLALTLCWLDGAEIKSVWSMVQGTTGPVWRTVRRELLKPDRRRSRAGV
jgi:broad specificity phosphatase PhoE